MMADNLGGGDHLRDAGALCAGKPATCGPGRGGETQWSQDQWNPPVKPARHAKYILRPVTDDGHEHRHDAYQQAAAPEDELRAPVAQAHPAGDNGAQAAQVLGHFGLSIDLKGGFEPIALFARRDQPLNASLPVAEC